MKTTLTRILLRQAAWAALLLFCAQPGRAETLLVVNRGGTYRSADVTGHAEEKVDWLDANPADDTECTESFAALELQHYLQKMTGNFDDFDIVSQGDAVKGENLILVGNPGSSPIVKQVAGKLGLDLHRLGLDATQLAELGPEGYRIKSFVTDGRRVTIAAGGGRVGTLYAAYDLLHRLGCRWLAPGDVNEEIPHMAEMPDFEVTEKPAFALRRFHSWEERVDPGVDFLLWMARNRMNSWTIVESKAALMRKLGIQMSCGSHAAQSMFIDPSSPYPYNHRDFAGNKDKPADPYPVSKEYQGDANKDGVLSYFEAHPEWYAMVDHKRIPGIDGTRGYNFCTSNADATAEYLKNYLHAIIDGPYRQGDVILFWTTDSGSTDNGKWCQCDDCKALGSVTDRYLRLIWQFDREIKKAQQAGLINRPIATRFMIYRDVLHPPTHALPADFDYTTCTGTFFPAVRCYLHDFNDPDCSINVKFMEQLRGWVLAPDRFYRGPVGIGEYYNIHRFKNLPLVLMHMMEHDIPWFYREAGVRQFDYMHVTTENWGSKSLTNYQLARQLWDLNADCPALWEDYFAKRYGPAAATMRGFYGMLEQVNFNEIKSILAGQLREGAQDLFPTSHLRYEREPGIKTEGPTWRENLGYVKVCRDLIDRAAAIEVPERIRTRIAEDERLFTYGERTIGYYDALVQTFRTLRAGQREVALGHYAEAQRLAELLRQDTVSTKYSWDHLKALNALEASSCENTLDLLAKQLNPNNATAGQPTHPSPKSK